MQKGKQKLHVLARLSNHIDFTKLKLAMGAFIKLQFNCFPLVWMLHFRRANVKLNKVFEKALRTASNDSGNNSAHHYCNLNKS